MKNNNDKVLIGLKKAKSHLEKIIKMRENGEYCIDVMQQNLAVTGLLRSVHKQLMEGHLNSCFLKAVKSGDKKKEKEMIEEILAVTSLYNR